MASDKLLGLGSGCDYGTLGNHLTFRIRATLLWNGICEDGLLHLVMVAMSQGKRDRETAGPGPGCCECHASTQAIGLALI